MYLSIALCTYNGAAYLPAQLASLAAQTRRPDELVVCDDGSSDATVATLSAFASDAPFPVRVRVNPVNLGTTKNFEQAIAQCQGDVIFLCDQDDVWHPQKLARFEAVFAADPAVGLVFCDAELVSPDLTPTGQRLWDCMPFTPAMRAAVEAGAGPRLLRRANFVTGAVAAFRAEYRDILLPIPTSWFHDGWIGYILAAVANIRLISDPLHKYRRHPDQQVGVEPLLSLGRRIRYARGLTPATFTTLADGFDAVADRLAAHPARVRDESDITAARRKAAHSRVRARLRAAGRLRRVAPAVRELLAVHYHEFGRGFLGFASDLLARPAATSS